MGFLETIQPLEIWQVDVFTGRAFAGNPAAVVFGAQNLSDQMLQAIARETNLSETVFMTAPRQGGDYYLRTFTVQREIPFAVHPAIAAAHAYQEACKGGTGRLRQECAAGTIEIKAEDNAWFATVPGAEFLATGIPTATVAPLLGRAAADMVGSGPLEIVAAGPRWMLAEVVSRQVLRDIVPNHTRIAALTGPSPAVGLAVFARDPEPGIAAEIRTFAPAEGIFEDPVCGSCAGSVASLMRRESPDFASSGPVVFVQGHNRKRPGRMLVRHTADGLSVGGHAITVMRGRLEKIGKGEMPCPA